MFHGLSSMNICLVLLLILVRLRAMISNAEPNNPQCVASSCGDVHNITQPFRLKSDPNGCGDPKYEMVCEDNRTVLYFHDNRFYVQSINYSNNHIRLVYDGLEKDNCSSLAHYSWVLYGFRNSFDTPFMSSYYDSSLVIVNCSKVVNSAIYIATSLCIKGLHSSNTSSNWNLYALFNPAASDVRDFCTISGWMKLDDFMVYEQIDSSSDKFELIHKIMADGSTLSFSSDSPSREKTTFITYFILVHWIRIASSTAVKFADPGLLKNIVIWTIGDFIALLGKPQ
ncbi:uncharacterized protein LOC120289664 [Eucalyptus grandis]|uniref:uncharacterized protein LOC120289664 n=1 Tax=Eucalyptus grandis TaxID=71139 RepID=UPI00192EC851|nr:uncharacterized protein LOC120289664 [Eucalyptus grandis]